MRRDSRFVVLDAAMNDLIRPAMYEAWHGIVPVAAADAAGAGRRRPTWSGRSANPATPSRADRMLPPLAPGARVAILDAGAYGAVMSSAYNARPAGGRGDGGRQRLVGDPRPRRAAPTCGAANACHIGSNERPRRRVRSPAAPARRPPRRWPAWPSCSSASGRRCGRRSASPACSSAPRCSTCRACCRRGGISRCSP